MKQEKRMGVLDHLEEFRSRLIIALVAILVTTALGVRVFRRDYLFSARARRRHQTSSVQPAGWFYDSLSRRVVRRHRTRHTSVDLSTLRYIEPALMPGERRLIIPGAIAMVVLFLLGNAFGYAMLHNMMSVLFTMFGSELNYLPSADQYISFVIYFLVTTGVSFELPIILLILMRLGILKPDTLRKQRKIAWFIIFVFAELVTPVADPIVAPTIVMMPMILLFELALFTSRFIIPKPAKIVPPSLDKPAA